MKPGLSVLPMDVWADVFVFPWIKRKKLARIVHKFKERAFAEKLQKFLHDPKCGKHAIHYFNISFNQSLKLRNQKIPECQATLKVSPNGKLYSYTDCEYPQTEMPENITRFNQLSIGYLDDQVIDFLHNIKPVFTNVFLDIRAIKSAENMNVLFTHLLPMLTSIRGIECNHTGLEVLEQQFPGTLAMARELDLPARMTHIQTYLNWLTTPLDFAVHGPRFLKISAGTKAIFAIIDAIHKQFMAAITPSTFAVILELNSADRNERANELAVQNATTNEQLIVRNAIYKKPMFEIYGAKLNYVEVVRHQVGEDANMREWVKEWEYYECKYKRFYDENYAAEQVILVTGPSLNIGQISKEADAMYQSANEDQSEDDEEEEAGPSTSKKMKKE